MTQLGVFSLIIRRLSVCGSGVASIAEYREMLQFAATHKVAPMLEHFPLNSEGINTCVDKVEKNTIRFRGVLVAELATAAAAAAATAAAKK